jgi:hypothetical protein
MHKSQQDASAYFLHSQICAQLHKYMNRTDTNIQPEIFHYAGMVITIISLTRLQLGLVNIFKLSKLH